MKHTKTLAVALGAAALIGSGSAAATSNGGWARDTRADYTPLEDFQPVPASAPCPGEPTGYEAKPFVLPAGYRQQVILEELVPPPAGSGTGTVPYDLWDMNTQNETGTDAGRYVYRTHETGNNGAVTFLDLQTGETGVIAERADFERLDGLAWTPWNTLIAAEEVITATHKDPTVPQAQGGLVYELFLDPADPTRLAPSREPITAPQDGTQDYAKDGIRARPAVGARSHEGLRFDRKLNLYGIAESRGAQASRSGGIFRFEPDDKQNPLATGQLYALQTQNRHDGEGRWIPLDREASQVDSDTHAEQRGANEYERPEDVETDTSTGRDVNGNGDTLYVAITGTDEVLAIDLHNPNRPFAYHYVYDASKPHTNTTADPNVAADFDSPDNLALDADGNLAITEDPGSDVAGGKKAGDDIWIAAPPQGPGNPNAPGQQGRRREEARTVQRFATLEDCDAEPSGVYFLMEGTQDYVEQWDPALADYVHDETLLVHRMHSGQFGPEDQLVAITPNETDEDDEKSKRNN